MKRYEIVLVGAITAALVSASGCMSTPQAVPPIRSEITSTPSGATIKLDGDVLGTTPFVANIPKKPVYKGPAAHSTTFAGTPEGIEKAFAKIREHEKLVYYTFEADREGHKTAEQKFTTDYGIPPTIHFDLKPRQSSTNK